MAQATLKNSYSRIVWDLETLELIEKVGHPYDGAWDLCKESDAQKQAREQQNAFNQQLMDLYKVQFAQQQEILATLLPQLQEMAKNPEGFGATEYAALQAKIVNDVGGQYSNVAKAAATEFATTNEAGLPSGVEAQVQATIAAGAAEEVAGESQRLAIANEQLKQEQRNFAISNLANIQKDIGGQLQSTGEESLTGLKNQFEQATTVYNQGSLWKNILSGVVGAGLNFATGGLSGIMQGGSFFSGAGQQLGGQPVTG